MTKQGYTISQMSEISKISKKALRFYDDLGLISSVLPGFPWVADLLMSFGEDTNEGHGPVFPDSWADRALVC